MTAISKAFVAVLSTNERGPVERAGKLRRGRGHSQPRAYGWMWRSAGTGTAWRGRVSRGAASGRIATSSPAWE